jgi:hypothetical protein
MIIRRDDDGKREGLELAGALPEGAEIIGTIERSSADVGALVKLKGGMVVQLNAGVMRNIPFNELQFMLK